MNTNDSISVKELAGIVKGFIIDKVHKELEKSLQASRQSDEELETMLVHGDDNDHDAARKVRALRFREALAGLESLLVGQRDIYFAPVLDHILQNIGATLQALGLLTPAGGLVNGPHLDYRSLSFFPAMVAPRRYVPLPMLTQAMSTIGLGRYWPNNATVFLAEYREWQPRFWGYPAHDDERMGLFVWNNLGSKQICFLPLNPVPGSQPIGINELVLLNSRPSIVARLLDSDPSRQEHVVPLSARHFILLLRALLLDYEHHHTARQREIAEQDQLGAMLWDFLSSDE
ncbi:MAG: hypothetical protein ACPGWR_11050 [Ardenticatenaceae bacterium]